MKNDKPISLVDKKNAQIIKELRKRFAALNHPLDKLSDQQIIDGASESETAVIKCGVILNRVVDAFQEVAKIIWPEKKEEKDDA